MPQLEIQSRNLALKHTGLVVIAIGIAVLHYLTPTVWHHFHTMYLRMFYLPIILASFWLGLRGALLYAGVCTILFIPHIYFQWPDQHEIFTQLVEVGMFFVVGSFSGFIFDIWRKQSAALLHQQGVLAQAERLALVGRMAAGLAHEIRNPLASLLGSADILKRGFKDGNPDPEFVDLIEHDLKRLNRILDDFLRFARPRKAEVTPLSPIEVVQGALALARPTLAKMGTNVESVLEQGLPLCWMDGEQVKQILFNLLLNAAEAMQGNGTIQVQLNRLKDLLVIVVKDEGPGISEEEARHLFEPFFTTKENGNGLGLAISRQLAEGLGGSLCVTPQTTGAGFELVIPMRIEGVAA